MSLSVTKRPAVANIKLTQSTSTVADLQMTHKCLSKLLLTLSLNQGDLRLLQSTEIPQSVDPKVSPAQRSFSSYQFGQKNSLIFLEKDMN